MGQWEVVLMEGWLVERLDALDGWQVAWLRGWVVGCKKRQKDFSHGSQ